MGPAALEPPQEPKKEKITSQLIFNNPKYNILPGSSPDLKVNLLKK